MTHFALPLGAVLDRKYRLEEPLGQGGMGAVFRATHLGTDRVVALKVIAPGLMDQQDFVARFQREARATGRLRHPNIVDLTDFGFAEVEGQHVAYLVMEFLEGETLGKLLQRSPTPPIPFLVDVIQQVCSALQEAHDKGIVHRDLKPDNLWLEPDRRGGRTVKILDFGLAKLYDPKARAEGKPGLPMGDAETIAVERDATKALPPPGGPSFPLSETQVGTMLGTPAYMSPEQCRAVALDSRSDLYSLGVILYQMLSGRTPFHGDSLALINSHIQSDPPDLAALRPDLPSGMARLVLECLSKDPDRRPPSAEILGNAFEAHARSRARQFQRGVSILVDRWHDIWKLARPHAVGPFVLLMFALGLALGLEDQLSASERLAWFSPLYLAAVAWVFYAQGVLKGMVAPVVLVHTLAPHLPLSGAWSESFQDASSGLRRLVMLNILLAFSGAFLFIPLFRLLRHIPPGGLTASQKVLASVLAILITGCFFGLLAYSLRRKGGSLAGMAPCAMLVEGLTDQGVGPRMTALRKAAAARDPSASHHEESYLALSFLVLSVLVLLLGNLYLKRHGGAGGDQSFLAFNGLLACALYPGTFLLTLLDALVTNLDYFALRQVAREPLREDFEKLRETMEQGMV